MASVSVVMPNYNCGAFIEQAIESVRAQTFADWELLICDDCSTDSSWDIISRYASLDPRIKAVRHEQSLGSGRARNGALAQATGRYISFLDSDDYWKPVKLERHLAFMNKHNAAMSHTWYDVVREDGTLFEVVKKHKPVLGYHDLLRGHRVDNLTTIYDTAQTGTFSFGPNLHEDFTLVLSFMRGGLVSHCLPESLGSYRIRKLSRSSQKLGNAGRVWRILGQEKLSLITRVWFFAHYFVRKTMLHVARRMHYRWGR